MTTLLKPISIVGRRTLDTLAFLGGVTLLVKDASSQLPSALVTGRGRRLGWTNLWFQMVRVGVRSIPIISLVVFCIGAILALQMAPILEDYGETRRVADIIAVAMFRELGPLVAAIVLTGFAGASIAAELGTMVVSEEIEALEAHAIQPVRFLVVPRVVATTVMMVCLAVVANCMGVTGGLLVAAFFLEIEPLQYLTRTFESTALQDFFTGLTKAAVFGLIIASLACHLGLAVRGGAQGVGIATTRTVVLTIVALIIVDLLFTTIFYAVGI